MSTRLQSSYRGAGKLVVLALVTVLFAGNASADDSFTLSKFADFSSSNRFFHVDDTLYMRVVSSDLDPTGIETNEFTLTPKGSGTPVSGTLENHLDGTFTAAFPLSQLQGETRSWEWSVRLADDDGHEFHARVDIVVQDGSNLPEVFELRGEVEEVGSDFIVISGHRIHVDIGTQVFAGLGVRARLQDLRIGDKVIATVKEDLENGLRAILIFIQGDDEGELEISGTIGQVLEDAIVVNGVLVRLDDNTVIRGPHGSVLTRAELRVGLKVKVRARLHVDGFWLAIEIRIHVEDGEVDVEAEGKLRGIVTEVGEDYLVVSGLRFEVDENTRFENFSSLEDLAVGDRVIVEFEVQSDGTLLAREIELEDEDDDDSEIEVRGTITALTDSTLEVGGITFFITADTRIEGKHDRRLSVSDLSVGLLVEVEGRRRADGRVVAIRVKVEVELTAEIEIKGVVEAVADSSFKVAGLWIQVTAETRIEVEHGGEGSFADIEVGVFVEVKVRVGADSVLVAVHIEIEHRFGEDEVQITGMIDSLASDAIVVAGQLFKVDANTRVFDERHRPIDYSELRVGQVVKVRGRRLADGSLLAVEIRLKVRIHAEAKLVGPITAIHGDTVEVIGIPIRIGPQTIFEGVDSADDLQVGQWVKVHFRILPGGDFLALRIKVKERPGGVVEFSGVIEEIGDNTLTVSGVPLVVTAATEIRGKDGEAISFEDLEVGMTVEVRVVVTVDGLVVLEIHVKATVIIAATIEFADGSSISLADHEILIDPQTLIVGWNNVPLTAADLRPGFFVEVIAVVTSPSGLGKSAGGTAIAEKIEVKQTATATGVGSTELEASVPTAFTLLQNYPNPFNPGTTIRFVLRTPSEVTLRIYNLLGQEVRTLMAAPLAAGSYQVQWDGRDQLGRPLPTGVYIYRLAAAGQVQSRRMVLIK